MKKIVLACLVCILATSCVSRRQKVCCAPPTEKRSEKQMVEPTPKHNDSTFVFVASSKSLRKEAALSKLNADRNSQIVGYVSAQIGRVSQWLSENALDELVDQKDFLKISATNLQEVQFTEEERNIFTSEDGEYKSFVVVHLPKKEVVAFWRRKFMGTENVKARLEEAGLLNSFERLLADFYE